MYIYLKICEPNFHIFRLSLDHKIQGEVDFFIYLRFPYQSLRKNRLLALFYLSFPLLYFNFIILGLLFFVFLVQEY